MKKIIQHIISILLLTLFFSCQKHEKSNISTYNVSSANFEDNLSIDGIVEPVQTTTMACPGNVDGTVTFIINDGTFVKAGDTVCILEDKRFNKEYDDAKANLEIAQADLNKTKVELDTQYALLEAQVKTNAAETNIANLDSLELKFSSPNQRRIKLLELEKVSIEKRKLQNKLKALAIINQSEVRKLEMNLQRFTMQVQSCKSQLDQMIIKAPQDGLATKAIHMVTRRKVLVGDPVWNGMPLVVIPELTKMRVKIYASEGNYKRINVNDSVEYTFEAMPENRAWGKITKKAPVGQPIKENSKVKMFEIEASMDKSLVIPGPDLTTNCRVILKQINDTIVIPQVTIYEEDSMKFVYVKKGKTFEMRQIATGTSSSKEAVVAAGLKLNEKISLLKPEAILINGKKLLAKSVLKKYSTIK